jgi:hypothetical protein
MGAATTHDRAVNRCAATVAWLAGALVDIKALLHLTIAIWGGVIVDRRAASGNGFAQHADDREVQRVDLGGAQRVRRGKWMDPRAPKRLIGVDVADPNDAALVEQEALDACRPMPNQRAEGISGERCRERLNAVIGKERRRGRVKVRSRLAVSSLRNKGDATKGTHIPESKLTSIGE